MGGTPPRVPPVRPGGTPTGVTPPQVPPHQTWPGVPQQGGIPPLCTFPIRSGRGGTLMRGTSPWVPPH